MDYIHIGNSKVKCSRIVFGAWAIGGWMWGGCDEKSAIEAIQASLDNGVTGIDTAPVYGMGLSEKLVAKGIRGRRDQVFLATKCGLRWDTKEGSDPWESKDSEGNPLTIMTNSRAMSIRKECEDSLKRLNVEAIDLLQIHWPDESMPIGEAWEALVSLKKEGKVLGIGVCNFNLKQLQVANEIAHVDTLQSPYSLLRRDLESDLIPYCKKSKITTLAYSPLERGLLTGKSTADRQFSGDDHRASSPLFSLSNRTRVNNALVQIEPIARRHQATISQVIIATTLRLSTVDVVLVGARNALQAKENACAGQITLSEEEVKFVSQVLTPQTIDLPV